jgi:hypothetical protein
MSPHEDDVERAKVDFGKLGSVVDDLCVDRDYEMWYFAGVFGFATCAEGAAKGFCWENEAGDVNTHFLSYCPKTCHDWHAEHGPKHWSKGKKTLYEPCSEKQLCNQWETTPSYFTGNRGTTPSLWGFDHCMHATTAQLLNVSFAFGRNPAYLPNYASICPRAAGICQPICGPDALGTGADYGWGLINEGIDYTMIAESWLGTHRARGCDFYFPMFKRAYEMGPITDCRVDCKEPTKCAPLSPKYPEYDYDLYPDVCFANSYLHPGFPAVEPGSGPDTPAVDPFHFDGPHLRMLMALCPATAAKAGIPCHNEKMCAPWCNEYTCGNSKMCGGCGAHYCPKPDEWHCAAFCTEHTCGNKRLCGDCTACKPPAKATPTPTPTA